MILATIPITGVDLTSRLEVGDWTAPHDQRVTPVVRLHGLDDQAAATIVVDLAVHASAATYELDGDAVPKRAASVDALAIELPPVSLKAGDVLRVFAESTNGDDDDVSGELLIADANAQLAADAFANGPTRVVPIGPGERWLQFYAPGADIDADPAAWLFRHKLNNNGERIETEVNAS